MENSSSTAFSPPTHSFKESQPILRFETVEFCLLFSGAFIAYSLRRRSSIRNKLEKFGLCVEVEHHELSLFVHVRNCLHTPNCLFYAQTSDIDTLIVLRHEIFSDQLK